MCVRMSREVTRSRRRGERQCNKRRGCEGRNDGGTRLLQHMSRLGVSGVSRGNRLSVGFPASRYQRYTQMDILNWSVLNCRNYRNKCTMSKNQILKYKWTNKYQTTMLHLDNFIASHPSSLSSVMSLLSAVNNAAQKYFAKEVLFETDLSRL